MAPTFSSAPCLENFLGVLLWVIWARRQRCVGVERWALPFPPAPSLRLRFHPVRGGLQVPVIFPTLLQRTFISGRCGWKDWGSHLLLAATHSAKPLLWVWQAKNPGAPIAPAPAVWRFHAPSPTHGVEGSLRERRVTVSCSRLRCSSVKVLLGWEAACKQPFGRGQNAFGIELTEFQT